MSTLRRALIIGIDTYKKASNLSSCVADATEMAELLRRNEDGTRNYTCKVLLDKVDGKPITHAVIRKECTKLFADFKDDVLFYFSGHGALTPFGGHLCAYDSSSHNWGVPMQEIVSMATSSKARDILIILDCCNSGDFGDPTLLGRGPNPLAAVREDMSVIAASLSRQPSLEMNGHGVFTSAVLDALRGGAADHMGWVTAPSIFAYVERRFGAFEQRPVYKSYATNVRVVRHCAALIDRLKLNALVDHFGSADYLYRLDPEHEPEDEHGKVHKPINKKKVAIAALFKEYRDAGLLKPSLPGEQLYWTARRKHTVELTKLGREYWWLVSNEKL